jgi:hypothetical protein
MNCKPGDHAMVVGFAGCSCGICGKRFRFVECGTCVQVLHLNDVGHWHLSEPVPVHRAFSCCNWTYQVETVSAIGDPVLIPLRGQEGEGDDVHTSRPITPNEVLA